MLRHLYFNLSMASVVASAITIVACDTKKTESMEATDSASVETKVDYPDTIKVVSDPLVTHIYTADPSAHVFNGKIYIYPSHDIESDIPDDDLGSQYAMRDYRILSLNAIGDSAVDNGVAIDIADVPWAGRQMWAPDAAHKDGKYYLYFPVKDKKDIFHIGVAVSDSPTGPFKAQPKPIEGSFSMDPAVFEDTDGSYYMYFGGIWGGQLQRWQTGKYIAEDTYPADSLPALSPKIAKMADDMVSFAEQPKDVQLLDENGDPITAGDNERRFFEASWVHKYKGKYYFSYSTGDTHYIAYGMGDSPYGPFTYKGIVLKPVLGWTNHHSIVEKDGKWYLFYHDASLSGGKNHLRSVKVAELKYREDGTIIPMDAFTE